jgi:hypothetical protein
MSCISLLDAVMKGMGESVYASCISSILLSASSKCAIIFYLAELSIIRLDLEPSFISLLGIGLVYEVRVED